jgi:hypothetical protein
MLWHAFLFLGLRTVGFPPSFFFFAWRFPLICLVKSSKWRDERCLAVLDTDFLVRVLIVPESLYCRDERLLILLF